MGKQNAPAEPIRVEGISGVDASTVTGTGVIVPMDAEPKPDFAAKLRAVQTEQQRIVELPDGSVRVNIVIESEMVEPLREWANGAGETFEEYLPKIVSMGLQAIVLGGSVAG